LAKSSQNIFLFDKIVMHFKGAMLKQECIYR